jgi:hypothetical protein
MWQTLERPLRRTRTNCLCVRQRAIYARQPLLTFLQKSWNPHFQKALRKLRAIYIGAPRGHEVLNFSSLFWNHQTVGICLFCLSVASPNRHGRRRTTAQQQVAAMVQAAAVAEEGTAAKAAALVARLKHACVACAVRRWEWAVGRGCGVLQPARSREKASIAASDICASLDHPRCSPNRLPRLLRLRLTFPPTSPGLLVAAHSAQAT